ncbi:beta-fructofuranosidase, insoluble isoenzyme 3-like [Iris pallida]|uniref:Beta-fructofuranosidase, insoluble isoenzyme 3-like n=1 Tax=Iris pallida TaxID=29817 RepID=A0AAX6IKN0_IRIPA|nr:beta-fructofuranosidase, insoluble isoenzyme 3-like [Iris pallida]
MERFYRVLWVFMVLLFCWRDIINVEVVDGSHLVLEDLQSVSAAVVDTKYKTGYHFQPPEHWINDPNGPMYYNGVYHLFYQYNPKGAVWGNIVWAHSVSTDMINWRAVDPAIYPSKPFDINGCWSGSATILPGNKPVILYTGVDPQNQQVQNIAFPKNLSDPDLREWVKPDYNPIIAPVDGINGSAFRDPTTAWLGPDRRWRLVIGTKRRSRGVAVMYRSKDFIHWVRAKHPLHSAAGTGMWECPDFFPVAMRGVRGVDTSEYNGELKYVFKVSLDLTRYEYYTIGSYRRDLDKYVPDGASVDNGSGLRYDYGNFYASKSFFDAGKKRRILWGWTNESDSRQDDIDKGWAGIQTVPRAVWLDPSGKQLIQWPIEELERLRGRLVSVKNKVLRSGGLVEISGILTSQANVVVSFEVTGLAKAERFDPSWSDPQKLCERKGTEAKGGVGPFGLLVLASSGKEEYTSVFFRIFKSPTKYVALMCQDPSRSSVRAGLYKPVYGAFVDVDIKRNGQIALRSLIDHSAVESFGGEGRVCITSRVYPGMAVGSNAHLYAFNYGAEDVKILDLKAWEMKKPLMNGA